jgi:hypothetical protein
MPTISLPEPISRDELLAIVNRRAIDREIERTLAFVKEEVQTAATQGLLQRSIFINDVLLPDMISFLHQMLPGCIVDCNLKDIPLAKEPVGKLYKKYDMNYPGRLVTISWCPPS